MTISIKPTASGSTIEQDGSTILTVDGSGNISAANNFTATGHVLKVASTTKTDTWNNATQNTWNDVTGLSVSITPSSTSSKILITGHISYSASSNLYVRIVRDSTPICVGDTSGNRISSTVASGYNYGDGNVMESTTWNYMDSPSITSAITYKIQVYGFNVTQYVNRVVTDPDSGVSPRGTSTITVMEVAG